MTKEKEYWYILHIPTGNIVSYWLYSRQMGLRLDTTTFTGYNFYDSSFFIPRSFYNTFEKRKDSGELHFKSKLDARAFLRDYILSMVVKLGITKEQKYLGLPQRCPKDAEFLVLSSNNDQN